MQFFSIGLAGVTYNDRELEIIKTQMEGMNLADPPGDMFIGMVMARTGRLPSEIEREDYVKLVRAWQIVGLYDRRMSGAKD